MAEKKIQENPLPDTQASQTESSNDMAKVTGTPKPATDKPDQEPKTVVTVPEVTQTLTKTERNNELYRKLLPAALFLLTFVTVMTMLLIYMDTVALGAAQFRLNMSRDYELARIPQESPKLVAFVRQLHLAPRAAKKTNVQPQPTDRNKLLDQIYGEIYNGTFIEFLPRGPRDLTAQYLETARSWSGVVVRAAARDYLALRGASRALHACLSPTDHPREVTYQEPETAEALFRPRVLCLPLLTVLLAADATEAQYLILGGSSVPRALTALPFDRVSLQVIDYRSSDPVARNETARLLLGHNYSVAATYTDGVIFTLNEKSGLPTEGNLYLENCLTDSLTYGIQPEPNRLKIETPFLEGRSLL